MAEDAFGAFIAVYGRDPGLNLVAKTDLCGRVLSEFAVEGELRLVDLTGPGAARIGATGAISTDPHELVRPWSRAIFEHPSSPEGIYYRLEHDLGRKGVAIFDREGSQVPRGPRVRGPLWTRTMRVCSARSSKGTILG